MINRQLWVVLLLIAAIQTCSADEQCYGPLVQISTLDQSLHEVHDDIYGALAGFGGVPFSNITEPSTLQLANPSDACNPTLDGVVPGKH